MVNINSVLKEQLARVRVSDEDVKSLERAAEEIVRKLPNARVGGSLAKGTLIKRDKQDVDIFVIFKNEKDTGKLDAILRKAKLKAKVKHGSRDYFQIESKDKKVVFEIIPVVSINAKKPQEAGNVTDVSLTHVDYVKKKLRRDKKLADEIKLAKAFCHACDCYGAESYIKGFSGYALEVLVIYFGSFVKFLRGVGKKKVLDLERYFKSEREVLQELNASKLQSPIVVVDPTYKFRNVAAGLSKETFDKFLIYSAKFLKSPSIKSFEKKKFDVSIFEKIAKQKKSRLLKLKLGTDRQEGDIAGTKMRKFFDFVCDSLNRKEQKVLKSEFIYSGSGQKAEGYIILKEKKEIEVGGVEINLVEAVKNFKKVRGAKNVYAKKGKVYAKEKVSVEDILKKASSVGVEMAANLEIVSGK